MYRKSTGIIDLAGKVCLVTGGSRGLGRAIAAELAYHGAKCYVTGRHLDALKKVNEEVESRGGSGECVAIECNHENDDDVKEVFDRIGGENDGKLDLLVNNVYSAVTFIIKNRHKEFWNQPSETWDVINNVGLRNHYLCAMHAAKMMVEKRQGLIINIGSIGGLRYIFSSAYCVGKSAKDRMAAVCAAELRKYKVAFVSLWPGFVRTDELVEHAKNSDIGKRLGPFVESAETPTYVGRAVAALMSETHQSVMEKTGKILLTTDIGREHGITDENGRTPTAMFQLNNILYASGYHRLYSWIPDFVRIPFWMIRVLHTYRDS